MLSPKKYVPLRTKVLEMSLEVDDAEEHGLWAFSDGAQEQSMGQRLTYKIGEHSAARGSSCVLELHVCKLAGESVRDGSSVTGRKDSALGKGLL